MMKLPKTLLSFLCMISFGFNALATDELEIQALGIQTEPLTGVWMALEDRPYVRGGETPCALEKGALLKLEFVFEKETTEFRTAGTVTLNLLRQSPLEEDSWYTAFDRADFTGLNRVSEKVIIPYDDEVTILISHKSSISEDGHFAQNSVFMGVLGDVGNCKSSSITIQSLEVDSTDEDLLTYEYFIDGETTNVCKFIRYPSLLD